MEQRQKNQRQDNRTSSANISRSKPSSVEMSTFDKLITFLTKTYPKYSVVDFKEAIFQIRQQRKTLTGLSLQKIEELVLNVLDEKYPTDKSVLPVITSENNDELEEYQESVSAALWKTFKRLREYEQTNENFKTTNESDEEKCLICLDCLTSNKTETFACAHTFHRHCLEEWFKIERTCPLCRKLTFFSDEFPNLK